MTTLSLLLFATLASVTNAENFFVQAHYRKEKCEGDFVNLFESQPQSSCVTKDGVTYSFWNCTSGDPAAYFCGKDSTCSNGCTPTGRTYKSGECLEYPIPGRYSGVWSRYFCSTSLVPFPGVSFNLARSFFTPEDCVAANTANLRIVTGEAVYCANKTKENSSTINKCIVAPNGDVSSEQHTCLNTETCASCTAGLTVPGRKCDQTGAKEYTTDVCFTGGPSGATTANSQSQALSTSTASVAGSTATVSIDNSNSNSGSVGGPESASADLMRSTATVMATIVAFAFDFDHFAF